jgi:hypothetical protein
VKELELESAGPGTATAPETELGSQLFTNGRLPARGRGVGGGTVISGLGDGVAVGVAVANVAAGRLRVAGTGEDGRLAAFGVAQPAMTSKMATPKRPAVPARSYPCGRFT